MNFNHSEADSTVEKCECISKFLYQIRHLINRRDEYVQNCDERLYAHKWCLLFSEFIMNNAHCTKTGCNAHSDDMLWYVPIIRLASTNGIKAEGGHLQVFRRQSRNKPVLGDQCVNWEETVCLNFILQQLDYYVTCAVCTKSEPKNLQIHQKTCQKVYASPSRRRMDIKGECEEITYPRIYFAIDNFDEVFGNMAVTEGECICVELIAHDRYRSKDVVLFLGSVRHDVLQKLYESRSMGTWNWAHKLINNAPKRCYEFMIMRGPHGRGRAEMAVARAGSNRFETPMSDSFDFRSAFDEDAHNKQRRVSETGMFNRAWNSLTRSGVMRREAMTPGPASQPLPAQRRWRGDSISVCSEYGVPTSARCVTGEEVVSGKNRSTCASPGAWSMRGIGEALQFLQEKPENTPLNAYLTNIMLPWNTILEDMMSNTKKKPLLTFELDMFQE